MEQQEEVYRPLGSKTLMLFILRKSAVLFLFLIVAIICVVVIRIMPVYATLMYQVIGVIIKMAVALAGIIVAVEYIMYTRYGITLGVDNLKITRGFINHQEFGIPYRRVKHARIERDIIDQLLGTSDIFINTTDTDEGDSGGNESFIMLPAIEKNLAARIQGEILRRAQIEEIRVHSVMGER
ncbi:MAG: PH domain-containing protein [bacterium]|nr:PH domain-containing protein [bacterium]MDZ4286098.1 PH domain-containing protein [Candidatus Sungbacteria bacterium]